MRKNTCNAV